MIQRDTIPCYSYVCHICMTPAYLGNAAQGQSSREIPARAVATHTHALPRRPELVQVAERPAVRVRAFFQRPVA